MPRKQHDYHYIYKTTNLVNNKFYIGMHSTSNLDDGYIGSGKILWYSIKKYGRENFKMEILEFLPDRSSLKLRESELVNESLLQDPLCMNLQIGGGGGFSNEEHQMKCSLNGGKSMKGRKNTILSDLMKSMHENKKIPIPDWSGKKHKPETIEKFKHIRKETSTGSKNSQYGKCWIFHEDFGNKSIEKNSLESYLSLGWKRGRKMK
jgi:hypothetical protein